MPICLLREAFDPHAALAAWRLPVTVGAAVHFIGYARADEALTAADTPYCLRLEHYPGMTEQALDELAAGAMARWPSIEPPLVMHRVGELRLGEAIVLVAVASPHRREAFLAAEYLMDCLKTSAPFWKFQYQAGASGYWVAAKESDRAAEARWRAES